MEEVARRYRGDCNWNSSLEEGERYHLGKKVEETAKQKSVGLLRGTSLCVYMWVGTTCADSDSDTGREATGSREQLGSENNVKLNQNKKKRRHLRMKVVEIRLRWAGHTQGMNEERLTKRAWKTEQGGRRRTGRPKLR